MSVIVTVQVLVPASVYKHPFALGGIKRNDLHVISIVGGCDCIVCKLTLFDVVNYSL